MLTIFLFYFSEVAFFLASLFAIDCAPERVFISQLNTKKFYIITVVLQIFKFAKLQLLINLKLTELLRTKPISLSATVLISTIKT